MLKKLEHYTWKERWEIFAHKAANVGLIASAGFFVHPLAATAVIGYQTARYFSGRSKIKDTVDAEFVRFAESHPHSPNLGKLAAKLYEKSGLSAEDNPIYNSVPRHYLEDTHQQSIEKKIKASKLRRTLNAYSYESKTPAIMISERMLEILTDEEEYAVLAHEFAHSAADHHALRRLSETLHKIANLTHLLGAGRQVIKSGFMAALNMLNGLNIGNYTFNRLFKKKDISPFSNDPEADLNREALRGNLKYAFNTAVLAGVGALYSVPLGASVAAAGGTLYATKILAKSLARCNEYHADRLAVSFDADPLALVSALRKMEILTENENGPNTHQVTKQQSRRSLGAFFRSLNMTHPATDDRYDVLIAMARKQGATDEDIERALNPELSAHHLMQPNGIIEIGELGEIGEFLDWLNKREMPFQDGAAPASFPLN